MTSKINGRTPDEIKKWLTSFANDIDDLFYEGSNIGAMFRSILAYIRQLERERDAAIADFTEFANSTAICALCKDFKFDEPCEKGVNGESCWQWRGVQEVSNDG